MLTTSFRLLHNEGACRPRYRHLAKALGGIRAYGRETPITIMQVLEHNGLEDALWALVAVPAEQRDEMRRKDHLFACWCLRNTPLYGDRVVWDLLTDERLRVAVEVAERFAVGAATGAELIVAKTGAGDAALAAYGVGNESTFHAACAATNACEYYDHNYVCVSSCGVVASICTAVYRDADRNDPHSIAMARAAAAAEAARLAQVARFVAIFGDDK